MKKLFIYLLLLRWISLGQNFGNKILLDSFEDLSKWEKIASDGVDIEIYSDSGASNKCVRIDFNFKLGSGYCGIRKRIDLNLPDNYQFTFYVKGNAPSNNLEFKLIDSTGENVWWLNQRNFEFPSHWKEISIKKRHISFAWGPRGGGEIEKASFIELIISSATGGRGSIWIDELSFQILEPDSIRQKIPENLIVNSSSGDPAFAVDKNLNTYWESEEKKPFIIIDLGAIKEYGGLVINWDERFYADKYKIMTSVNGNDWIEVYNVKSGSGGKSYIFLGERESRFIKIQMLNPSFKRYRIYEIDIKDVSFSASFNDFFKNIACDFPDGYFPKYFKDRQVYWTVIGLPYDGKEALVSEDGIIEVDKSRFTVEPFLFLDGKLYTYNDVGIYQTLEEGYLPIPIVTWNGDNFKLEIKSFASGDVGSSFVMVKYGVKNAGEKEIKGKLFIGIRPFQVLPPWQKLNIIGGVTKIGKISYNGQIITVDDKKIIPSTKPNNVGFSEFDHGEIIKYLSKGILPEKKEVKCDFGYASGAIEYDFVLKANEERSFYLVIPFYETPAPHQLRGKNFEHELKIVKRKWKELIAFDQTEEEKIRIDIPDDKLLNTLRSNLAYILINADIPQYKSGVVALQPGSRTYERSWIRDGALISNSLLYFGFHDWVKSYLDWYSKYQYENGKIPCVVDQRGPDPVPEHDSNGEFIYSIAEYYRFTNDVEFVKSKFEKIKKAVDYVLYLISQRKTPEYSVGDKRAYYGILTESISHEGYSAKPMHSYWDNFWALKGFKDATVMARVIGRKEESEFFERAGFELKDAIFNSLKLAIESKNIDYIPGCVELGDFDPTSTAVAIFPTLIFEDAIDTLRYYLINTFKRYRDFFKLRKSTNEWLNYTPYELRLCATFIRIGDRKFANEMMDFFIQHQRPFGWNMWAEVVWNQRDYPGFIGDMPHSWVGAEFINSFRTMFAYEKDSVLFLLAGVREEWFGVGKNIVIENLPTYFGKINIYTKVENCKVDFMLKAKLFAGAELHKVILVNPLYEKTKKVYVNGEEYKFDAHQIIIDTFPVKVEIVLRE